MSCCQEMSGLLSGGLLRFNARFDEYTFNGIKTPLSYCPYCGQGLAGSRRDQWVRELSEMGYDDPLNNPSIPAEYRDDTWYKSRQIEMSLF